MGNAFREFNTNIFDYANRVHNTSSLSKHYCHASCFNDANPELIPRLIGFTNAEFIAKPRPIMDSECDTNPDWLTSIIAKRKC